MMSREEILSSLDNVPFLDIFELTEEYVICYDELNGIDLTIRFAETFTKEDLKGLIHISPGIPPELQPDVDALADYLWEVMDHYAFLTLSGLWFVYSDEDYGQLARFYDYEDCKLLPEHDARGMMCFDYQACIVDVGRELKRNPRASVDFIRWELIVIALHELRHLMMDTNPTLPSEEYPPILGTELMVRQFAQDLCEEEQIYPIFPRTPGQ